MLNPVKCTLQIVVIIIPVLHQLSGQQVPIYCWANRERVFKFVWIGAQAGAWTHDRQPPSTK